jgi:hypothetical protein
MIELRKSPRINVIWRAALRMPGVKLTMAKVINISSSGLLLQSPIPLTIGNDYQMMVEIPGIDQFCNTFKVTCTVRVMHAILSGDFFHIGLQFTQLSDAHQELVNAWISKTLQRRPILG